MKTTVQVGGELLQEPNNNHVLQVAMPKAESQSECLLKSLVFFGQYFIDQPKNLRFEGGMVPISSFRFTT